MRAYKQNFQIKLNYFISRDTNKKIDIYNLQVNDEHIIVSCNNQT